METHERSTELMGAPPASPPPEEPPPGRELWPWLLVLALLVVAGLAAAWYATRDSGNASSRQETRLTTVAAPAPPKRHVTTQAKTTTNTTPTVAQVAVPDLVGQKRGDAVHTLEAAGLTANVAEVESDQEKDIVVAQDPSGGAKVDKGSAVALSVSKGKEKPAKPAPVSVTVPNVVGESEGAAVAAIKAAGLKPSTQDVPSTQDKHIVVSQSPGGGTSAQKGAGVLLNVSEGPPKVKPTKPAKPSNAQPATATVPSVIGETEGAATADIQAAGFTASSVDQPTSDPSEDGVVVDQSPSGGSDADPNSTVTIYVGHYNSSG